MFSRLRRLLFRIAAGLVLPAAVYDLPHRFKRPVGSDIDRMRADVARIGDDFRKVIALQANQPRP